MKRTILAIALLMSLTLQAQMRWTDPLEAGAGVQGQGWSELNKTYVRLPDKAESMVRDAVWSLSRNSAGLSIIFRSNAPEIHVKYKVKGGLNMFHMPSTGVSGVDLYATDSEGVRRWCAPDFTASFSKDSILYRYSNIDYFPNASKPYEYHLYLPLYNTVESILIGVPEGSELVFYPTRREKPIVVYGTSIGQGACASRPGNAWTNIVERELEHPLVNLAFSGNGRMEPELFSLLSEIDAALYVIDCLPNLHAGKDPVRDLTVAGVKMLKEAHPDCPVLLVEHSGYMNEVSSIARAEYRATNSEMRRAYNDMIEMGVKGLYYLTTEEIGLGMDGMVEGVHPNDLGMRRQADGVEKKVREILHETCEPYAPCRQHRDSYVWFDRHEQELALCAEKKPSVVLIGDSITHFWAGEPDASRVSGKDSWKKLWKGREVVNLGFGWDRIENVLWRIYHGELDGYRADDIFILIGTNNLSVYDKVEDIVDGINEIVDAVYVRQPSARIFVSGILPRQGYERKVEFLNKLLQARLHYDKAKYVDASGAFLGADGKIDPACFIGDGLHPGEEGYRRYAEVLAKAMAD